MKWGHTKVYPNQYICLVGPSGIRKGEPVMVAGRFMQDIQLNTVAEQITLQALIRRMKDAAVTFPTPNSMGHQCAMAGIFEELAVFLGENNIPLLAALTNWYDARERWTYDTKNSGIDEIVGVCFNFFGSMADDWVPVVIPPTAIGGGFTSRVIFIVESLKAKTISNPNLVTVDVELRQHLVHDLEQVQALQGQFRFTREGLAHYEEWYTRTEEEALNGRFAVDDPRFSGYNSRRATHVKKLAMACSASRGNDMQVTETDFERALALMHDVEPNMPSVFGRVGRSPYSEMIQVVSDLIQTRGKVHKSELFRLVHHDIDLQSLNAIEEQLKMMRYIQVEALLDGSRDHVYHWIDQREKPPRYFDPEG